ncbi:MAG: DUF5320 domain-containing protein [Firmicutes bacterium]|nr:DUF5320 domain-containing protein [Bacillota bacterium]
MPRGDGTGPMGLGPMTGRTAGYCAGYLGPGFANPIVGFGWGCRGLGRRFWGAGYGRVPGYAPGYNPYFQKGAVDSEFEARVLSDRIEIMEQSLKEAKERLKELQKSEDK